MRIQLFSENSHAQQIVSRTIAIALLFALLMIGTAWPMPASGQVTAPDIPAATGMGVTSPLAMRSTRPAGIPLGATELATPGISPVTPSQGTGMTACSSPGSASSPTPLFDGGGLSRNTTLSCADSQLLSSPLPTTSSVGRAGIPLGATELGSAGISAAAPVTSPSPGETNSVGNP